MVMPPLTLTILAGLLHMHGSDATVTSDNKGLQDLLGPVREQLEQKLEPNSPRIILAAQASHVKGHYFKTYVRHYLMNYIAAKPGTGTGTKPGVGSVTKPPGGKRR